MFFSIPSLWLDKKRHIKVPQTSPADHLLYMGAHVDTMLGGSMRRQHQSQQIVTVPKLNHEHFECPGGISGILCKNVCT